MAKKSQIQFDGQPERQNIPKLFATAVRWHQQRELNQALVCYQQVLTQQPDHIDALINLGSVLKSLGRSEEAIASYRRALNLKPDSVETWFNLGNALLAQGQSEAAVAAYQQAVQLQPNFTEAQLNLAKASQAMSQVSPTPRSQQLTTTVDPLSSLVEKYQRNASDQSASELRQVRRQLATEWLKLPDEQLVSAHAGDIGKAQQVLLNSGIKDELLTDPEQTFTDELTAQGFEHPQSIQHLLAAMLYRYPHQLPSQWYKDVSIPKWFANDYLQFMFTPPEIFSEMGEVDNYYRYMQEWLAHVHTNVFKSPDSQSWQDAALFFTQNANFIPLYFTTADLKELYIQRAEIMEFALKTRGSKIDYVFPERLANRQKIRLGILNHHFTPQTETFATIPAFEHLDRNQFEIILYAVTTNEHPLEQYCQSRADKLVKLPDDLTISVQTIRADDLDILFIGTNVTAVSNPSSLLALHRLARVQVTSICSPVTTGMRTIDYYIAGNLTVPTQEHYREKLLKLDGSGLCLSYPLPEDASSVKLTRSIWGVTEASVVFISGANFYKIIPELREAWAKIIAAVSNSILVLYPFNPNWKAYYPKILFVNQMRAVFAKYGIEPSRLVVINPLPSSKDVEGCLQLADVYLDSYPYGGATSLLDPLKVGLPTVVMEGNALRFLLAPAQLLELQITDLIADNEESYIQSAIFLGTNPEQRSRYRQQIQQSMRSNPRFLDSRSYSAQIGVLFQQMFQEWQRSTGAQKHKDTRKSKIKNLEPLSSTHKGFGAQVVYKGGLVRKQERNSQNIAQLFAEAVNWHQQQQFDRALASYQEVLAQEPNHVDALTNLGSILKSLDRSEEAIACYRRVLELKPDRAETWFNLGNTLQAGDAHLAVEAYRQALQLQPKLGAAHFNLGKLLQEQGELEEAAACYQQAIAQMPNLARAYTNLGNVLKALGQFDQAVANHQQALQLQPDYAEAHYNLGNTLTTGGQHEAAVVAFRQALQLQPNFAEAHLNLAGALQALSQTTEAELALKQALIFKPDLTPAYISLGRLLQNRGEYAAAVAHFQQALERQPGDSQLLTALAQVFATQRQYSEAAACFLEVLRHHPDDAVNYYNLGSLYNDMGRFNEAITNLRQAVQLNPNLAMAYSNLGYALSFQVRLTEAIDHCQQAIEIDPNLTAAYMNMGFALNNQGRVAEAVACFHETLRIDPDYHSGHSNFLYSMNYQATNSPDAIATAHRSWGQRCTDLILPPIPTRCDPNRRLRVGYVSPDFRQHSVAYFIEPILAHHDPEQVETIGYANVAMPDSVTDHLRSLTDEWCDVYNLNDDRFAERVRADGIDILVDLAGHTGSNRLPVFARKPAPVQVTYLGYPNTTGLDSIDYRFTDAWADPPGLTDNYYTEELIRLPGCFLCYKPPITAPPVMELPAKTIGRITFGSFNNLPKLTPEVIALWARILHAVPTARLILKVRWFDDEPTRSRYQAIFADHNIDSTRVKLIGLIPDTNHHLSFYSNIDISLDPFPYNGTTTTCEALWMGVPAIALAGRTHVSRVGVSLLTAVGLPELIAASPEEYVTTAVSLAADWDRLAQLRSTLRERVSGSICNAVVHTQAIEAKYRSLWQRYCQSC